MNQRRTTGPRANAGMEAAEDALWDRLRSRAGTLPRPAGGTAADPTAADLLHRIVRLRMDAQHGDAAASDRDRRRRVRIAHPRSLAELDLAGADLRLLTFTGVSFDRASLAGADLRHATFHGCSFAGAELAGADARGAEFRDCRFRDPDAPAGTLAVAGMRVDREAVRENGGWTRADLERADARRQRYSGAFGRLFFAVQRGFLGDDFERLEEAFLEQITEAVDGAASRAPHPGPTVMIDLMAGGSSRRLKQLVGIEPGGRVYPDLHILALDRDLSQLREVLESNPPRFRARRIQIGTDDAAPGLPGLDLERLLLEEYGPAHSRADVIIAKKALHELPRGLQPRVIRRCFRALAPGGRLVLFADSPRLAMHDAQHDRLQVLRRELAALYAAMDDAALEGEGVDGAGRAGEGATSVAVRLERLRETLTRGLVLGGGERDLAFFCNLWVHLKDWANGNLDELANRYFSSLEEIREWCRSAGFRDAGEVFEGHYRMAAPLFNEVGIQKVADHLERHGPDARTHADHAARLAGWLAPAAHARFALFCDVVDHHLRDGTSPLGRIAVDPDAPFTRLDFGRIDPALGELGLEQRSAVALRFPVHVLAFEKPGP